MRTIYRSHQIDINTEPSGEILFDVFNRNRQHLLAGFSRTDIGEQAILERMKARVDKFVTEAPVSSFSK